MNDRQASLLTLDDDSLAHLFSFLEPKPIYSVSKCCKRLRSTVAVYLKRFPARRYPIQWDYGKIEVSRRGVTVERQKRDPVMKRHRTNYISVPPFNYSFDEFDEMLDFFAPAFKIFHFRASRLNTNVLDGIDCMRLKDCAKEKDQTLLFDVDLNDLSSSEIGAFLTILNPVALHFYGFFDRSVITGEAIPLRVQNIYITENPASPKDAELGSRLDLGFFQRILTSWKDMTEAGLILPRTEWHDPLLKFDGNHRSLYIDHCRLTVEEVREIWKIAYSRFGINQTIRFFNVRKRELLALNYETPQLTDGANLLPTLQAEMDNVQISTGKTLCIRFENGVDNEGSRMAVFDNLASSSLSPFNSEQTAYMSCHLVMNQCTQGVRALLPQVIYNSERYTIVRRNPRRND